MSSIDEIVDNALRGHKRRASIQNAVKQDLGLIYHKDDVNAIARQVIKDIFTEKIKTEIQNDNLIDTDGNNEIEILRQKHESLNNEINNKKLEIQLLKQTVKHLSESKKQMTLSVNESLNEMRLFLVKYQRQLNKIKPHNDI
mmetsp:Transcript_27311/g.33317  ORF Transcript_27311/g.33317 Transcript_27311/m.33317 type:complete len:142 (+) Transcript_27311:64-489(+)